MKELLGSLELNRIYQLDVLEGLKLIPDESVDLVVCDPPYGINYSSNWSKDDNYRKKVKTVNGIANDNYDNLSFLEKVVKEIDRVLKHNSHFYWFTRWDKVEQHKPMLDKNILK